MLQSKSSGERALFGFGFAVDTAVGAMHRVGELENMRQFLLDGGDTAGIFTLDDILQALAEVCFFSGHNGSLQAGQQPRPYSAQQRRVDGVSLAVAVRRGRRIEIYLIL